MLFSHQFGQSQRSLARRNESTGHRSCSSWASLIDTVRWFDEDGGPPVANASKALELGLLMEEVHGPEVALPYLRVALDTHRSDGPLRFAVARLLLGDGREEGLEVLGPLFEEPPDAVAPAHHLASDFFRRRGQVDEARHHLLQALEWERQERPAPQPEESSTSS